MGELTLTNKHIPGGGNHVRKDRHGYDGAAGLPVEVEAPPQIRPSIFVTLLKIALYKSI